MKKAEELEEGKEERKKRREGRRKGRMEWGKDKSTSVHDILDLSSGSDTKYLFSFG